jgi:CheB methylesterase
MFRSAAQNYGAAVIILSGNRDNGTAGLLAIENCCGIAIRSIRGTRPTCVALPVSRRSRVLGEDPATGSRAAREDSCDLPCAR